MLHKVLCRLPDTAVSRTQLVLSEAGASVQQTGDTIRFARAPSIAVPLWEVHFPPGTKRETIKTRKAAAGPSGEIDFFYTPDGALFYHRDKGSGNDPGALQWTDGATVPQVVETYKLSDRVTDWVHNCFTTEF